MMSLVWSTLTVLSAMAYLVAGKTRSRLLIALMFGVFFYLWINTTALLRWWVGP